LIWAKAEAFADSPDKVIGHSTRVLGKPVGTDPTVRQSLMTELLRARRGVMVSSPYLVPDRSVMEDIAEGRLWNLPITLITNSLASTDEPWVHAGYQRYRTEMLDLGVRLYEVAPSRVRSSNLGSFGQSIGLPRQGGGDRRRAMFIARSTSTRARKSTTPSSAS
jgi:putative cardiolipin synthase